MAIDRFIAEGKLPFPKNQDQADLYFALYAIFRDVGNRFLQVTTTINNITVGGSPTTPSEEARYLILAASLDPDAYVYLTNTTTNTVPANHTWYMVNCWNAEITSVTDSRFFMRAPRSEQPVVLPAGTTIKLDSVSGASLYYFDPLLVASDPGYDDPRALYFARLSQLESLLRSYLSVEPAGTVTGGASINTTSFPADFERAIVVLSNAFDVPWVALQSNADPTNAAVALNNEVSDNHQFRAGESIMLPFNRSEFPKLMTRGASVPGALAETWIAEGIGSILYAKLPDAAVWNDPAVTSVADFSATFNVEGAHVGIPHISALNLTTAGTVMFWAKRFVQTKAFPMLFTKGAINDTYLMFFEDSTSKVNARINDGGLKTATDPNTWAVDTWEHWAIKWDGSNVRLVRAGATVATTAAGTCATTGAGLVIADGTAPPASQFFGLIKDWAAFNVHLSDATITSLKNDPSLIAGTSGLAAYYSCNNHQGFVLTDSSANANHGTCIFQDQFVPYTPY